MFETIAFVSTVGFILIFVALVQLERSGRRDDGGDGSGS